MSPPRFLAPQLLPAGLIELESGEAQHATQVLRLQVGASVMLFDGAGGEALGTLVEASKRRAVVEVIERRDTDRELRRRLHLLVSLPKGDRQKVLVDGLVQLGVHALTPLITSRSVAQPGDNALERLRRAVVESSKQCGRNQLMQIHEPVSLVQPSAQMFEWPASRCFVAHPYHTDTSLATMLTESDPNAEGGDQSEGQHLVQPVDESCASRNANATSAECIAMVGPEGGLADAELAWLKERGWRVVGLGTRILRIEMAALQIAAWWATANDG